MNAVRLPASWVWSCALILAALAFSGCGSDPVYTDVPDPAMSGAPQNAGSGDFFQVGDLLNVVISDLPEGPRVFEQPIPENGTITLLLNERFSVLGKTRTALEQEIRNRYVPKYFVNMTVNIKPAERFFYVDGEVKGPGRQIYTGPITVLKAIATAGYFTDFAKKTKVLVTRADKTKLTVDCVKAIQDPSLDVPIYPNDKIHVPRRVL